MYILLTISITTRYLLGVVINKHTKEKYGNTIIAQTKRIGSSADWSRNRFTMDDGLNNAVKKIYRLAFHPVFILQQLKFLLRFKKSDWQFVFTFGVRALRRINQHIFNLTRSHSTRGRHVKSGSHGRYAHDPLYRETHY